MAERRHGVDTRGRSPPPRHPPPRSRDFNPSRNRKYSPCHRRGTEEYSREAERSRVMGKRHQFDRDFNLRAGRFSDSDDRAGDKDRGRHVVGARRSRSPPRRIEKKENFDRDVSLRTVRLSDYVDGGKDKDKNGVSVGHSRRSYDEDSYRGDSSSMKLRSLWTVRLSDYDDGGKEKDKIGVGVEHSRRSYDDLYRGDSSSMKFQVGHSLDEPRKSDHLAMKDYSHLRDYYVAGDSNITRGGGEREYYPHSRYSGRDGMLSMSQYLDSTKPVLEYERGGRPLPHSYTLAHGGVNDIPTGNLTGGDSSNHMASVTSRHLNTDTDKPGYFHFRDELHLEKRDGALRDREDRYFEMKDGGLPFQDGLGIERPLGREIYNYKEVKVLSAQGYLKGDSDYMVSSSQPKDYLSGSSLREGFPGYPAVGDIHMRPHVNRPGNGLASEHIGFDGYSEKKQNMSPRGPGRQLDDTRSRSRLYLVPPEEKRGDQFYAEFGRSKIDSMTARPSDLEEEYGDQRMPRIDVLNPKVDESSHKKYLRGDGLGDQHAFPRMQSTPDKFDACESLHAIKQDLDMLGTGSSRLNYGTGGYRGYGSVKPEEHNTEVDGGPWSRGERSDILQSREYDPSLGGLYGSPSPRQRLALADLSLVEPSERRLKHKLVRDGILYEQGFGIRISTDGNGGRKIYNQVDAGDEIDLVSLLKKPKSSKLDYEETWRASREMANYQTSSSKFVPSHSVNPCKSDSRDIKMRLGPVPGRLHVSQRLVKKYKPSIKKRLAPAPPKKCSSLPWMKNMSSNRMACIQDDSDSSRHDQDGDHLGDHHPLAKREPPEKSEDFKQLVESAFFKFLKQINETPTKRRKYMEQGNAGSLKCIVCGSNSDEFVETERLATHAFTSKKVGLRSQHLGLHKALCVLMGWKITEEPSSEWHCEVMSNAETSALKEDLIIWPPVVIVHNSSIDNKNPDERVIVSTEKLDMKLRGMDFGSILKVCNGKPANQSVMVVKFNGTLSGLQEAERFHRSYVESRHGRAELKQLKSKNGSSSGVTQVIPAEESFLYGHLGIAEDLDKLDFDTKKRCVLRSKKKILSIVDAPLDTEGKNGFY